MRSTPVSISRFPAKSTGSDPTFACRGRASVQVCRRVDFLKEKLNKSTLFVRLCSTSTLPVWSSAAWADLLFDASEVLNLWCSLWSHPPPGDFLGDEVGYCGKGANTVISQLHYYFEHHGLGETDCTPTIVQVKIRIVVCYLGVVWQDGTQR